MPPLMALAFIGAGLYAGYRWVSSVTNKVTDEVKRATAAKVTEKDLGHLEFDPKSGVYKPVDKP
jgi:hypothetical protein